MVLFFRRFFAFLMLFFALAAHAQGVKDARGQIESGRLELTQIEAALQRETLDDARLADLKGRLEPIGITAGEIIAQEQGRADEIKARIEQFGPVPDAAKGQSESADVARDRAEQQRLWQEADETLRLARAMNVRIEQIGQAIADRRRANFTREILAQHASIASPLLWLDISRALPGDVRALTFLARQWGETVLGNLDAYEGIILVFLLIGVAALLPRARLWVKSGSITGRFAEQEEAPTRLARAMLALRMLVLSTLLPSLGLMLLYKLLQNFALLPGRVDGVVEALLTNLAFIAFMNGLSGAILAPGRPDWRLFALPDAMARIFWRMIRQMALIVALGRFSEAVLAAIVASLPLSLGMKGVMACLVAVAMAHGISLAFGHADDQERKTPPAIPALFLPLRLIVWAASITILGAALFGYVPLAGFLVSQIIWLLGLGLITLLLLVLIDEVIGTGFSSQGMFGRRLREATGLATASLDQISVLAAGVTRLILVVAVCMVALAPWGVDSSGVMGNLRAAFFGFQVGGVTISLSTIGLAIALFLIGFFITRTIQTWLDTSYLPHTTLDPGLRNSIRTIFGYIGIVLAAIVALSQLGLSLDKITIVAGALSVGIGFGLQSIVNNFVSGLILLWERPIRVGDWIVVGDEQGTVKRINVRATEIQTFDRASLIIPNAEFISGRVKNWMHADRTGRIIIPVSIDHAAEPDAVQAILREAALAHREVMSEPKPMVIFKNLGESGLDFELRCFVDVDAMAVTRSDLLFDILRRLKAAGISLPSPTRRLEITNLASLADPRSLPPEPGE